MCYWNYKKKRKEIKQIFHNATRYTLHIWQWEWTSVGIYCICVLCTCTKQKWNVIAGIKQLQKAIVIIIENELNHLPIVAIINFSVIKKDKE